MPAFTNRSISASPMAAAGVTSPLSVDGPNHSSLLRENGVCEK
jgi:hypothetical protein